MSQDNMPELPNEDIGDGEIRVWTTRHLHAYAREYAEMRVAAEQEACATVCVEYMERLSADGDSASCVPSPNEYRAAGAFRCAQFIRARSGAQDEGRTG